MYPVASMKGVGYTAASAFVNPTILQNPGSDLQIRDELNKIRIGLNNTTSLVTTYSFSPLKGMTSLTDPSGKTLFFDFDSFNRLNVQKDLNEHILRTYDYIYASRPSDLSIKYYNRETTTTVARTGCSSGQIPGRWTYVVPAGKYTSTISQQDANNQASNEITTNAASAANANAPCIIPAMIDFRYTNSTGFTYLLQLTNTLTNQQTNLVLPATSGSVQVVAGQVPQGTYNAYLFSPPHPAYQNFMLGNQKAIGVYSISCPLDLTSKINASAYIY